MRLFFSLVILLNAALIFWVELLFARRLLPTLGGSPAIWNTCLMFYQLFLLLGYLYVFVLDRLALRQQVAAHAAVMALAVAGLPWFLFLWEDPGAQAPVSWLLGLLTVSLGIPFFVLAAGAPLLQRWFSLSGHPDRDDPYFLYAASNLGSFLALALYPVALEPLLTLDRQTVIWKGTYAGVMLLGLASGVWAVRRRHRSGAEERRKPVGMPLTGGVAGAVAPPDPGVDTSAGGEPRPSGRRTLRWIGLAFLPSSLLLGVTTHITSEIAPVPLLWVVPLALYLLTFVVAFGPRRPARGSVPGARRLLPTVGAVGLLLALWALGRMGLPELRWILVLADLTVLAVAGLVCHTRLAADRPHPRHLAEFYLWLALGGALGGVFNTLIAPVLFTDPLEYPLALAALAFLIASGRSEGGIRFRPGDLLLGAVPGIVAFLLVTFAAGVVAEPLLLLAVPGALCLALAGRPARFGLAIAGLVVVGFSHPAAGGEVLYKERTFYGIHRVYRDGEHVWLAHGTTVHGGQRRGAPGLPLATYHPEGPAGSLFEAFDRERAVGGAEGLSGEEVREEVAVVGLGTGSMIAYGHPDQRWTFFELDPTVVRIAEDPGLFTYLADARMSYRTVPGDARISLVRTTDRFDLVVIDAFSSDAVPVHLLTREAIELYLARLRPNGWIALHISNRYADFSGVLGNLAAELGLRAYEARDETGGSDPAHHPSHWVVLSENELSFRDVRWRPLAAPGGRSWTDAYSSLLQVLRW